MFAFSHFTTALLSLLIYLYDVSDVFAVYNYSFNSPLIIGNDESIQSIPVISHSVCNNEMRELRMFLLMLMLILIMIHVM